MPRRILIADDDPAQRRLLEAAVARFGHEVAVVEGGGAGVLARLAAEPAGFDLLLLDVPRPEADGVAVLTRLREAGHELPVIVATARGGIDTVVAAMRAGAADFIVKPVSPERLQVSIDNALKLKALAGEVERMRRAPGGALGFEAIVTRSPEMAQVIALARRAAAADIPVMIEGESGVGKELVARAIQGSGSRRGRPFVTVNCGAIPETLVESTLFGHEKGAFTGAVDRHTGRFQEADSGTLFLDEVGELPADVQVKLLRALQDGEIDPVGAKRPVRVDVRLVSATNRSLAGMVRAGQFREDLFYRINAFPILVPPLRRRLEDIAPLARHFALRFAGENRRRIEGLRPDALALLESVEWPGNIRQLENAVHRAVILADGDLLTPADFPHLVHRERRGGAPGRRVSDQAGTSDMRPGGGAETPSFVGDERRRLLPPATPPTISATAGRAKAADGLASAHGGPTPEAAAPEGGSATPHGWTAMPPHGAALAALGPEGHVRALAEIEEDAIRLALDRYAGRMTEIARRLGIGRSTLYRKLKDYGLADGQEAAE